MIKDALEKSDQAQWKGENCVADKRINQRLPGFWREDRHLSLFLAFLVLMTIFVPMVGLSRPGRIAIDLSFGLMLLSGAIATVQKRMLMYLTIALTIFNPLTVIYWVGVTSNWLPFAHSVVGATAPGWGLKWSPPA
jgi:hypothetical protein